MLVGFGTHRGTVIAGVAWGAPLREMPVPPARSGTGGRPAPRRAPATLLTFPRDERIDLLTDQLPHRAIGVVYHPERERWGNYVPTVLGERYDTFVWLAETTALRPFPTRRVDVLERSC